jgi:hypothetical protein
MLPELDSIMTAPGLMKPDLIPCSIILMAGLSFMLPPGLNPSSLAKSRNRAPVIKFFNATSGVFPTADNTPPLATTAAWPFMYLPLLIIICVRKDTLTC